MTPRKRIHVPPADEVIPPLSSEEKGWKIPHVASHGDAVRAGLEAARERGVRLGAPKRIDRAGVRRLVETGMSDSAVARELEIHPRTVQKIRTELRIVAKKPENRKDP